MQTDVAEERRFWENRKRDEEPYIHYNEVEYRFILNLFGNNCINEKKVLEVGCGAGVWTANLSRLGAQVYYFDLSPAIVAGVKHIIDREFAQGFCADMHDLPFPDDYFDLVFGSMVLHHTRDHAGLGKELSRVLKPGGNAVFHENSSRNRLLMIARSTLVGRWGIPKNSSPGEHPLRVSEIQQVGGSFAATHIHHVRMVFFQMAVKYLLKCESGTVYGLSKRLDGWMYRWFSFSRPLSYYQILEFKKSG